MTTQEPNELNRYYVAWQQAREYFRNINARTVGATASLQNASIVELNAWTEYRKSEGSKNPGRIL